MIVDLVLRLMGIPWLGHGRRAEFLLVLGATIYFGLLLFVPNASEHSQVTVDLFWEGHGSLLAYPLAAKALIGGYGLVANINGWPLSRPARFGGGFVGFAIWFWFAVKFAFVGALATPGFVLSCVAVYACVGVMVLAAADLPPAGAPGNVGGGR